MANDLSNPVQAKPTSDDGYFEHGAGSDSLFGNVQLAQADGAQASPQTIHVNAPQDAAAGPVVIRVEVTPGSIVELPQPFEADAALMAKEGDGNLAIRVGDVTIVLQGYVEANSEQPVVIEGADNQPIDIATILASTDPAIDIQTAAGPDAGQNGQGADNSGAILAQLEGGDGLGGFEGAGTQDGTELGYRTIDSSIRNDFADPLGVSSNAFGFSVGATSGSLGEGFLRDPAQTVPFGNASGTYFGDFLEGYRDAVEHPGSAMFAGWADFHGTAVTQNNDFDEYLTQTTQTTTVNVNFTGATGDLVLTGLGKDITSNGSHVSVEITDGGHTMFLRRDEATAGDKGNALIAVVHVDGPDANGQFTIETFLVNRVDHDGAGKDTMDLDIKFEVYDGPAPQQGSEIPNEGGGDVPQGPTSPSIEGHVTASFDDDVPILEKITYHNQHDGSIASRSEGVEAGGSNIGLIDEDWLRNGANDTGADGKSNAGDNGDTGGGTCVTGCIKVNFGADGAANPDGATEQKNDADKHAFVLDTATYVLGQAFPYGANGLTSGGKTLVVLSVDGDHLTVGIADEKQSQQQRIEGDTSEQPTEPTDPVPGCTIFTLILDQDTGEFKFELKGPLDHGDSIFGGEHVVSALVAEQPENTIPLQFGVKAYDDDGDSVQAEIDIDVNDDVPVARDDSITVLSGSHETLLGDVIGGYGEDSTAGVDSVGADGAVVLGVAAGDLTADQTTGVGDAIQGAYGKLYMGDGGKYSYVRDPYTPGGVDDVFTYTLKDGDGDTSTATLTIHIQDAGVSVDLPTCPAETTVDEAGLAARTGEAAGSNEGGDSEHTEGTITITAKDGITSLEIGGETLNLATLKDLDTTHKVVSDDSTGTLTLTGFDEATGKLTYTYDLKDNTDANTTNSVSFDITVTDVDGDTGTAKLEIAIVDDAATATNDTDSTDNFLTATGNVMTNDAPGADSGTITKLEGAAASTDSDNSDSLKVDGQYGTLEMAADGTYTYTRTDGKPMSGSDVFTYTLTDGDGDVSTATLTINIDDHGVSVALPTCPADTTVDEAGLPARSGEPAGSDAAANSEHTGGTITITAADGVQSLQIGSETLTLAQLNNLATTHIDAKDPSGTLTLTGFDEATGALSYTFDLTDNTNAGTKSSVAFDIKVTDNDGDTGTAQLEIKIVDDEPTANCDTISATAGRSADVQFIVDVSGSMKDAYFNVPGSTYPDNGIGLERYAIAQMLAQHPEIQNVQFIVFDDGASKSVWMTAAQAVLYVQNGNNFNGGGSTDYDAALTKSMDGMDDARPLPKSDQTLVYFFSDGNPNEPNHGAGIDGDGSGSNVSQAEWQTFVDKNDITNVFTVGIGSISSGELAELTPISYPNIDVKAPSGTEDNFVSLAGSNNVTTLVQTMDGLVSGSSGAVTGNVTTNDVPGADGYGNGKLVSVSYAGTEHDFSASVHQITLDLGAGRGTLVIKDDGGYTYTPPAGKADGVPFSIDYTIQDSDGDQSTAQLKIDLKAAPQVDLDANCDGHNATASFVEDGGAVKIAPLGTISDDGMIGSMVVTLTNRPDGDATERLNVSGLPANLSMTYANGVLTITGPASAADYQSILRSIVYSNTSQNPNEADRTVTVVVKDTESTPLSSITHVVNVSVESINDAPTATALQSGLKVDEQVSLNIAGKGLSIADVDAGSDTMTVKLTVDDAGVLTVSKGSANVNISGSGGNTVTITGSQSEINKVLNGTTGSMTFKDDTDTPAATVKLTMTVNDNGNNGDGGSLSTSVQTTITINNINDKPETDLNGSSKYGADNAVSFTEDKPAVTISPSGTVKDDSGTVVSMKVTLSNTPDGAAESLKIDSSYLPAGVTASYAGGVLTINGSASTSVYQTILQHIVYDNTSQAPNGSDRTATVVVNDGLANSTSHSVTIEVNPVNDAPTATALQSGLSVNEQVNLNIAGKGLSIADIDAGSDTMTVKLTVGDCGLLTVTKGSANVSVFGSGGDTVTITGSQSEINKVLTGATGSMSFKDDTDTPAATVKLTMTVNDNGNNGDGGSLFKTVETTIAINAVNDAPTPCDDSVYTNAGTTQIQIAEWMLLRNDSDQDTDSSKFDLISGNAAVANVTGSTVSHDNGSGTDGVVKFTDTNGTSTDSKFDYTMTDGSAANGVGHVVVHQDTSGTLTASSGDDIVIVHPTTSTVVDAGSGDDIVVGGAGNDRLDGGADDDLIFGNAGNDTMIYGSTDKYDGGTGFDRIEITGSSGGVHATYNAGTFLNVEMIDLGEDTNRQGQSHQNSLALNAGDVAAHDYGTVGNFKISLFVIGDTNGDSGNAQTMANNRDNVELSGFTKETGAGSTGSFTDAATGDSHNFNVWTSTANPQVHVAIEQNLDIV